MLGYNNILGHQTVKTRFKSDNSDVQDFDTSQIDHKLRKQVNETVEVHGSIRQQEKNEKHATATQPVGGGRN